jgi:hypothetical protein
LLVVGAAPSSFRAPPFGVGSNEWRGDSVPSWLQRWQKCAAVRVRAGRVHARCGRSLSLLQPCLFRQPTADRSRATTSLAVLTAAGGLIFGWPSLSGMLTDLGNYGGGCDPQAPGAQESAAAHRRQRCSGSRQLAVPGAAAAVRGCAGAVEGTCHLRGAMREEWRQGGRPSRSVAAAPLHNADSGSGSTAAAAAAQHSTHRRHPPACWPPLQMRCASRRRAAWPCCGRWASSPSTAAQC